MAWFMADIVIINRFSLNSIYEIGIFKNNIQFSESDKILEECIFKSCQGWKA